MDIINEEAMERKVGDSFQYNGRNITVVEGDSCDDCLYKAYGLSCLKQMSVSGCCFEGLRSDKTSVIFVETK